MQYLRTAFAFVVAYVMRFFRPCVDDILADFRRKIDQLERVIDAANAEARVQIERRQALRREIEQTYADEDAQWSIATRASDVRNNLKEIIGA